MIRKNDVLDQRPWWLLLAAMTAVILGSLVLITGCASPGQKPPITPPVDFVHTPVCVPPGLVTACWHQPPGQPWAYIPPAPPKPAEMTVATRDFCLKGRLVARFHPYLQGIDVTWVCKGDQEFCDTVGQGYWWTDGTPKPRYDCALGPDLSKIRNDREKILGCPAVYWSHTPDEASMQRCTSAPNASGMSCDHWSLHNAPPYPCAPDTGYFSIPQGKGYLQIRSEVEPSVRSDIQYYEQK